MARAFASGVLTASVALLAPAAFAQIEGPNAIEFSFSNPGARSMGFGGAFVALADDATAAFANPAGLFQLLTPEISLEGRHWNYDTPFVEGGRVTGEPTGIGIDDTPGLRTATSSYADSDLAFVSLVYPLKKVSLAFYRQQLANFESTSATQGLFFEIPDSPGLVRRQTDFRIQSSLDIVTYGASGAYRISERFSLGLGVSYFKAAIDVVTEAYATDDDSLSSFFGRNSYLAERQVISGTLASNDTDWRALVGFLWAVAPRWSVGGVFRAGPTLEFDSLDRAGPAIEIIDPSIPPDTIIAEGVVPIEFPDVYGLGFSFRSKPDTLTVGFEWRRVTYSSILRSVETSGAVMDDADELHAGLEYVFVGVTPIVAVRFGGWLDPDHQTRGISGNELNRELYPPGDDDLHVAAGVGLAWRTLQLDFGADLSDRIDTLSVSAIYRF